jgi:ribose/xylose/arabinose/galactoside ABC-type transport system permease subunit
MVAVAGAALFLTQLGQMLQMLGLSSALQFVIEGLAIALGMALSGLDFSRLAQLVTGLSRPKLKAPDALSS